MSDTTTPEYRTGFDEAPSTFNQEDAAPADYPPPVSKEQALADFNYLFPAHIFKGERHTRLRRFIEQSGRSGVSADPLPRPLLTDLEIQGLRRQARNDPRCADQHWFILMVRAIESYYGVTGAAAQSQPLVEPTVDMVLVPREPTQAMLIAAHAVAEDIRGGVFQKAYRAMLAASKGEKA